MPLLLQTAGVLLTVAALALAAAPSTQAGLPFDTEHSRLTVYVSKEGLFAFAADNHVVSAPIASGSFDETANTVDVKVDAAKMQVQDPPSRRDKVQANMTGPDVLDIAKYPTIEFRSTRISAVDPEHWKVIGDLTLHGQTHPVNFDVVRKDPKHFTGAGMVKQTDFGITPIKIAGGTVRVKDDVKIEFDIALK